MLATDKSSGIIHGDSSQDRNSLQGLGSGGGEDLAGARAVMTLSYISVPVNCNTALKRLH